jgi:hypothetical protein
MRRSEASSRLFFTCTHLLLSRNNLSYKSSSYFVITRSHCSLLPIHSRIPRNQLTRSPQAAPPSRQSRENQRIPSCRAAKQPTICRPVVITSPRTAAACARALPARAAHLSSWTHRLRPTALGAAAPAPSTVHIALPHRQLRQPSYYILLASDMLVPLPGAKIVGSNHNVSCHVRT